MFGGDGILWHAESCSLVHSQLFSVGPTLRNVTRLTVKTFCFARLRDWGCKICRRDDSFSLRIALILCVQRENMLAHAEFCFREKRTFFVHVSKHDAMYSPSRTNNVLRSTTKDRLQFFLARVIWFDLFIWFSVQILRLGTSQILRYDKTFPSSTTS